MSETIGSFRVTRDESELFAALSGDYNPIHLDPLAARRLPHGTTVCHGVHVAMQGLDVLAARHWPGELASIRARFERPVRAGDRVEVELRSRDAQSAALALRVHGRRVQALRLAFDRGVDKYAEPGDQLVAQRPARELSFADASQSSGHVALAADRRMLERLFPALAHASAALQPAVLLATTQVVGMECPGAHSLFTGLELGFAPCAEVDPARLGYRVTRLEERFRLAEIAVEGAGASGKLECLFRPAPARQASFAETCRTVEPNAFAGQRALVIGGSRGLGEVTAKLLAAGGADDVTVTYAVGRADAEQVAAEIRAGRGRCEVIAWDVLEPPPDLGDRAPTHLYYFATPRIDLNAGEFDPALFHRYCAFYVEGFARALEACRRQTAALFALYPSTVFLDQPEAGTAEYVSAKGAGEALCHALVAAPDLAIACPRIPRLLTDQTLQVVEAVDTGDALAVMRDVLLHSAASRR